ncbi:thioesterase domain-containing protein [Streptomyces sp. NBC_00669]|uniref:thioesterase II family protein n=1 Tax=unclassified Streptomyces TaxID=2593676 RepID=UPI002E2F7842|nr:thioesterase domain-containing protein [Streptomyces sp. NBC_00669]
MTGGPRSTRPDDVPPTDRWFIRPVPDGEALLFCLPYTGMGASTYHDWPASGLGAFQVVPLQPPGREGRFREEAHPTHAAFAADLVTAIEPHVRGRRYAFTAHCGAVPYALETIRLTRERGLAPPVRLFASSWGAPHRGLYGRLNHVDLAAFDAVAEVRSMARQVGRPLPDDLAELAAEVLAAELAVQRGYSYRPAEPLPCPVSVIGWSRDDVVPDREVHDGWDECAPVSHHTLDGGHRDYLRCPPALRDLIARAAGR